jgi:hypothetical protein
VVAEARVDGGPLLGGRKRFMARAMGRAFPIRKRTCHIWVTLAEGAEEPARKGRSKKARQVVGGGTASPARRRGAVPPTALPPTAVTPTAVTPTAVPQAKE